MGDPRVAAVLHAAKQRHIWEIRGSALMPLLKLIMDTRREPAVDLPKPLGNWLFGSFIGELSFCFDRHSSKNPIREIICLKEYASTAHHLNMLMVCNILARQGCYDNRIAGLSVILVDLLIQALAYLPADLAQDGLLWSPRIGVAVIHDFAEDLSSQTSVPIVKPLSDSITITELACLLTSLLNAFCQHTDVCRLLHQSGLLVLLIRRCIMVAPKCPERLYSRIDIDSARFVRAASFHDKTTSCSIEPLKSPSFWALNSSFRCVTRFFLTLSSCHREEAKLLLMPSRQDEDFVEELLSALNKSSGHLKRSNLVVTVCETISTFMLSLEFLASNEMLPVILKFQQKLSAAGAMCDFQQHFQGLHAVLNTLWTLCVMEKRFLHIAHEMSTKTIGTDILPMTGRIRNDKCLEAMIHLFKRALHTDSQLLCLAMLLETVSADPSVNHLYLMEAIPRLWPLLFHELHNRARAVQNRLQDFFLICCTYSMKSVERTGGLMQLVIHLQSTPDPVVRLHALELIDRLLNHPKIDGPAVCLALYESHLGMFLLSELSDQELRHSTEYYLIILRLLRDIMQTERARSQFHQVLTLNQQMAILQSPELCSAMLECLEASLSEHEHTEMYDRGSVVTINFVLHSCSSSSQQSVETRVLEIALLKLLQKLVRIKNFAANLYAENGLDWCLQMIQAECDLTNYDPPFIIELIRTIADCVAVSQKCQDEWNDLGGCSALHVPLGKVAMMNHSAHGAGLCQELLRLSFTKSSTWVPIFDALGELPIGYQGTASIIRSDPVHLALNLCIEQVTTESGCHVTFLLLHQLIAILQTSAGSLATLCTSGLSRVVITKLPVPLQDTSHALHLSVVALLELLMTFSVTVEELRLYLEMLRNPVYPVRLLQALSHICQHSAFQPEYYCTFSAEEDNSSGLQPLRNRLDGIERTDSSQQLGFRVQLDDRSAFQSDKDSYTVAMWLRIEDSLADCVTILSSPQLIVACRLRDETLLVTPLMEISALEAVRALPLNKWNHIVIVHSRSQVRERQSRPALLQVYVNAVSVLSKEVSYFIPARGPVFTLGNDSAGSPSTKCSWSLSSFLLFNGHTFSDRECFQLYAGGPNLPLSALCPGSVIHPSAITPAIIRAYKHSLAEWLVVDPLMFSTLLADALCCIVAHAGGLMLVQRKLTQEQQFAVPALADLSGLSLVLSRFAGLQSSPLPALSCFRIISRSYATSKLLRMDLLAFFYGMSLPREETQAEMLRVLKYSLVKHTESVSLIASLLKSPRSILGFDLLQACIELAFDGVHVSSQPSVETLFISDTAYVRHVDALRHLLMNWHIWKHAHPSISSCLTRSLLNAFHGSSPAAIYNREVFRRQNLLADLLLIFRQRMFTVASCDHLSNLLFDVVMLPTPSSSSLQMLLDYIVESHRDMDVEPRESSLSYSTSFTTPTVNRHSPANPASGVSSAHNSRHHSRKPNQLHMRSIRSFAVKQLLKMVTKADIPDDFFINHCTFNVLLNLLSHRSLTTRVTLVKILNALLSRRNEQAEFEFFENFLSRNGLAAVGFQLVNHRCDRELFRAVKMLVQDKTTLRPEIADQSINLVIDLLMVSEMDEALWSDALNMLKVLCGSFQNILGTTVLDRLCVAMAKQLYRFPGARIKERRQSIRIAAQLSQEYFSSSGVTHDEETFPAQQVLVKILAHFVNFLMRIVRSACQPNGVGTELINDLYMSLYRLDPQFFGSQAAVHDEPLTVESNAQTLESPSILKSWNDNPSDLVPVMQLIVLHEVIKWFFGNVLPNDYAIYYSLPSSVVIVCRLAIGHFLSREVIGDVDIIFAKLTHDLLARLLSEEFSSIHLAALAELRIMLSRLMRHMVAIDSMPLDQRLKLVCNWSEQQVFDAFQPDPDGAVLLVSGLSQLIQDVKSQTTEPSEFVQHQLAQVTSLISQLAHEHMDALQRVLVLEKSTFGTPDKPDNWRLVFVEEELLQRRHTDYMSRKEWLSERGKELFRRSQALREFNYEHQEKKSMPAPAVTERFALLEREKRELDLLVLQDWRRVFTLHGHERAIWPQPPVSHTWCVDPTEGLHHIRNRLIRAVNPLWRPAVNSVPPLLETETDASSPDAQAELIFCAQDAIEATQNRLGSLWPYLTLAESMLFASNASPLPALSAREEWEHTLRREIMASNVYPPMQRPFDCLFQHRLPNLSRESSSYIVNEISLTIDADDVFASGLANASEDVAADEETSRQLVYSSQRSSQSSEADVDGAPANANPLSTESSAVVGPAKVFRSAAKKISPFRVYNGIVELVEGDCVRFVVEKVEKLHMSTSFATLTPETQCPLPWQQQQEESDLESVMIWKLDSIDQVHRRRHLLKQTAIELFMLDGQSVLFAFPDVKTRDRAHTLLVDRGVTTLENEFAKFMGIGTPELVAKWRDGKMSNFEYLMQLNVHAGRSFNDLTQYPIFPWILRDYDSATLDLTDPKTFRDLSKPMGAQDENRLQIFLEQYNTLVDMQETPYHYGSHYSNYSSVLHYLIRVEPFTQYFLEFQGKYDTPDRMFHSIKSAWQQSSAGSKSNVKELVPELFFLPEMLVNHNHFDFGRMQDGTVVDDVVLPPWAENSVHQFVSLHRQALESPYVTEHLHQWIDLIFGYKQTGVEAHNAVNVFHPNTYERVHQETDATLEDQIRSYGQVPSQLFTSAHPARRRGLVDVKSVFSGRGYLERALHRKLTEPIGSIAFLEWTGQVAAQPRDRTLVLFERKVYVATYTTWDHALQLVDVAEKRPVALTYLTRNDMMTCCSSAVSRAGNELYLVSGFASGLIEVRQLRDGGTFKLLASFIAHVGSITSLSVCSNFGIFCSACRDDGTVIVWDINRLQYIRSLRLLNTIVCVAIAAHNGNIVVATTRQLYQYSINGDLIAQCLVRVDSNITTIALTSQTEGVDYNYVAVGLENGCVVVHQLNTMEETLHVLDCSEDELDSEQPQVTALAVVNNREVVVGYSDGYVMIWAASGKAAVRFF